MVYNVTMSSRVSILRSPLAAVLFVGLVSMLIRGVLLAQFPFDGLYGQDAYYYLSASRDLAAVWGDPARLWDWLTVWGTPSLTVWPLGYHMQMVLASLFVGQGPASGQVVSFLSGVVTPVLTTLLTINLWRTSQDKEAGRDVPGSVLAGAALAGLVVALSALAVRSSLVVMSDMAGLFWATLAVLLATYYASGPEGRWRLGLLCGLCLGIASITRYIYPLILVPVLAYLVLIERQRQGMQWPSWAYFVGRALPIVAPVVLLVGLQLTYNWAHPTPSSSGVSPVIGSWNPTNAWQSTFDGPDGHAQYEQPMAYFFVVRPLVSFHALGLGLLPLFVVGLVALVRSRAFAALALVGGWWLLFAFFYSGTIYQPDRFILSYLPPLATVAGLGLVWLLEFLAAHLSRGGPAILRILLPRMLVASALLLAGLSLLMSGKTAVDDFRELYAGKQDYLRAIQCLSKIVPGEAAQTPVYSFQVTFTLMQYAKLNPRELFFETPASLDSELQQSDSGVKGYLVLPLSGFEEQWGRTPVGATFHHLQSKYNLTRVGCPGTSFTIFEIR